LNTTKNGLKGTILKLSLKFVLQKSGEEAPARMAKIVTRMREIFNVMEVFPLIVMTGADKNEAVDTFELGKFSHIYNIPSYVVRE
jgi:hypothetical protein